MREWHRLFFVNERRLRNFVSRGAIYAGSPSAATASACRRSTAWWTDLRTRSIGSTASGSIRRCPRCSTHRPGRRPRHSTASASNWSPGWRALPINLIVKLHDQSPDPRPQYSGGVDWVARLTPLLTAGRGVIASNANITPCLVASDLLITDHSSAGFEFLLRDSPGGPDSPARLDAQANIHPDYVLAAGLASQLGRRRCRGRGRRRVRTVESRRPIA